MNLHQFRFVQEAVRRNLNLTEAAKALHTSQPGISKAIIELEEELGVDIFNRHGKRIRKLTEPGTQILKSIETILREVNNLKRIGEHYSHHDQGVLSIATTHTQARYVLPPAVAKLRQVYPKVTISLHQGSPEQVNRMLLDDTAEIGIATEALADDEHLISLPCYEWQHMLVLPFDHPLLLKDRITLEDLAQVPLITYHGSFTGRKRIDAAFAAKQLRPNIVLEAIDSDVILTYVKLGMGVGIVAEMAVQSPTQLTDVVTRTGSQLFGRNVARVAFKRGSYVRQFTLRFAELISPRLAPNLIQKALQGQGQDDGI